jgi:hypothetical protein
VHQEPGSGAQQREPRRDGQVTGVFVLTLRGDGIAELTRFGGAELPYFGLPSTLG